MKTPNPTQLSKGTDFQFCTVIVRQNTVKYKKPVFYTGLWLRFQGQGWIYIHGCALCLKYISVSKYSVGVGGELIISCTPQFDLVKNTQCVFWKVGTELLNIV
jgi:hypothetical protein